jgi:hypothetical protein
MRTLRWIVPIVVLVFLTACSQDIHEIKTRTLPEKNPTSYVFPGSVDAVRERIIEAFQFENRYEKPAEDFYSSFNNPTTFSFRVESREDVVFSEHIFKDPENRNDVYLHTYGEPLGPSPVYFGGGKPLRYRPKFQLHLTAADDKNTKVTVITHDPSVINGSKCCGLHGYVSNDIAVEPTTIEEYRILLFIGRVLGVNDMPPLKLPENK